MIHTTSGDGVTQKSGMEGDVTRRWRALQEHQWLFIGVLAVLTLALGVSGFRKYYAALDQPRTFWDVLYLALQLFTLESGAVSGPVGWGVASGSALAGPRPGGHRGGEGVRPGVPRAVPALPAGWSARGHASSAGWAGRSASRGTCTPAGSGWWSWNGTRERPHRPVPEPGIIVLAGDATHRETLRQARVHRALRQHRRLRRRRRQCRGGRARARAGAGAHRFAAPRRRPHHRPAPVPPAGGTGTGAAPPGAVPAGVLQRVRSRRPLVAVGPPGPDRRRRPAAGRAAPGAGGPGAHGRKFARAGGACPEGRRRRRVPRHCRRPGRLGQGGIAGAPLSPPGPVVPAGGDGPGGGIAGVPSRRIPPGG